MQYKIIRKNIKSIVIRLDKYGDIRVSAPHWIKLSDIDNFVESKKHWIGIRQERLKNNLQKYENNARIPYFETSYILKLIPNPRSKILQNGDYLEIWMPNFDDIKKIEKLILRWYNDKSKSDVYSIISKYQNAINREVSSIRFRNMSTRWGSCNVKKATITLNTTLFSKPKICFEYVLLHELVHLIHANHGAEFYNVLESIMPNWIEIKRILES